MKKIQLVCTFSSHRKTKNLTPNQYIHSKKNQQKTTHTHTYTQKPKDHRCPLSHSHMRSSTRNK